MSWNSLSGRERAAKRWYVERRQFHDGKKRKDDKIKYWLCYSLCAQNVYKKRVLFSATIIIVREYFLSYRLADEPRYPLWIM